MNWIAPCLPRSPKSNRKLLCELGETKEIVEILIARIERDGDCDAWTLNMVERIQRVGASLIARVEKVQVAA